MVNALQAQVQDARNLYRSSESTRGINQESLEQLNQVIVHLDRLIATFGPQVIVDNLFLISVGNYGQVWVIQGLCDL
ncbi:unnamed protein product [Meloidogyne enterolobii]|uniref:Uncharacterized protein n=1 Tax=Meloidogyne enterolobii TaxID=390850 RepID=A0ACB0ZAP0_MELEN